MEGEDQEQADCLPCHSWSVGIPLVHTVFLLPSMDIKARLPLIDLLCVDTSLVPHRPYHVYQFRAFWEIAYWDGLVVAHFFMAVQLYANCLDEFVPIVGFHPLIPVKDVWVTRGCESNGIFQGLLDSVLCGRGGHVLPFILIHEDFPGHESLASLRQTLVVPSGIGDNSSTACLAYSIILGRLSGCLLWWQSWRGRRRGIVNTGHDVIVARMNHWLLLFCREFRGQNGRWMSSCWPPSWGKKVA